MSSGDTTGDSPARPEQVSRRRAARFAVAPLRQRPGLLAVLILVFMLLLAGRTLAMATIWPALDWVGPVAGNDQARLVERLSRTLLNALMAAGFLQLSLSVWQERDGRPLSPFPALAALPVAIGVDFIRDVFSIGTAALLTRSDPGLGALVMGGFLFSAVYQTVLTAFFGFTVPIALERRGNLVGSVQASLVLSRGRRWQIAGLTIGLGLLVGLLVLPLALLIGTRVGPVELAVSAAFGAPVSALMSLALGGLYRELREIEARDALTSFD